MNVPDAQLFEDALRLVNYERKNPTFLNPQLFVSPLSFEKLSKAGHISFENGVATFEGMLVTIPPTFEDLNNEDHLIIAEALWR